MRRVGSSGGGGPRWWSWPPARAVATTRRPQRRRRRPGRRRSTSSSSTSGCDKPAYDAKAGKLTFIAKNTTDARRGVRDPRARAADHRREGPGRRPARPPTLDVSLIKGDYELVCALGSDAERSTLTVTGEGGGATLKVDETALERRRARSTRRSSSSRPTSSSARPRTFAAAVESGNVEQAKELYAPGRIPWETIEPVAELFPEIDGADRQPRRRPRGSGRPAVDRLAPHREGPLGGQQHRGSRAVRPAARVRHERPDHQGEGAHDRPGRHDQRCRGADRRGRPGQDHR